MKKTTRPGRPAVGITDETVRLYRDAIVAWIQGQRLAQWLKDNEQGIEATQAFELIRFSGTEEMERWRQHWLSPEGWRRLQANVRQKRYSRGGVGERKKTLQLPASTVTDLKDFALRQGMTLNDAILELLMAREQSVAEQDKRIAELQERVSSLEEQNQILAIELDEQRSINRELIRSWPVS